MKKSTLITTIAMIVVVVVALSTATYAWFTSSAQNYVAQDISIASDDGLTVLANANNLTDPAYTSAGTDYSATTLLTNTQYNSTAKAGIRADLWAPIATLAAKPNSNASDATYAADPGMATFLNGTLSGTKFTFGAEEVTSPDLIRVTNNMDAAKKVTLTVYIGAANNDTSKLAAQGVSIYIADTTGKIANTIYTTATYSTTSNIYTPSGSAITGSGFTDIGNSINHNMTSGENPVPSVSASGWTQATAAAQAAGINSTYYFYTLTIDITNSLARYDSKVLLIYTWLDGLYLSDSAKGAAIAVGYSFGHDTAVS